MTCPKCGYLGFEDVDRCRNCGYEFALAAAPEDGLMLRGHDARREGALRELPLEPNLPLFGGDDEGAPALTRPLVPRTPLAVRRATPDVPRSRAERRPTPDVSVLPGFDRSPAARAGGPRAVGLDVAPSVSSTNDAPPEPRRRSGVARQAPAAPITHRLAAACVDAVVLLAIDSVVLYFTLRICGLDVSDVRVLPRVPLAGFFLMILLGYHVLFTSGGQTLGQMLFGIAVTSLADSQPPTIGQACRRTLCWASLVAPAGLGLFSLLLDDDRRGLHDRFTATRVVSLTVTPESGAA